MEIDEDGDEASGPTESWHQGEHSFRPGLVLGVGSLKPKNFKRMLFLSIPRCI